MSNKWDMAIGIGRSPPEKHLSYLICLLLICLNLPTALSAPPQASGNKFAVVFGVAFKGSGASGTDNTARLASWLLVHEYGFHPENVKLLLNTAVTHESIVGLVNWIVSVADEGSTVVFFYSGHGMMSANGDGSVVPSYWSYELRDSFLNLRSQKVLIVIDACFSGAWVAPLSAPNRIVISSAGFSYGFDGNHYTYFGKYFLDQAIRRGLGDANGDGVISVEEARNYAKIGMINDQYPGEMIL